MEMEKGSRGRHRSASRILRSSPYSLHSCRRVMSKGLCPENCRSALDKKGWEDATCTVCMESPHNAVLLLCSSHDKGCRPYMCGTSFRYSNCLDQYKTAYTKVFSSNHERPQDSLEKCVPCPLCRGQVKGWTVIEPVREHLNAKKRSCMQGDCSFVGTYRELRKHMNVEHPSAQPRKVDPILEQKWRRLEQERDREDMISTLRSTMAGRIMGDYTIEVNHHDSDTDDAAMNESLLRLGRDIVNFFLLSMVALGPPGGRRRNVHRASDENVAGVRSTSLANGGSTGTSLFSRLHRHGRLLLGRSGRRRRRSEANESQS